MKWIVVAILANAACSSKERARAHADAAERVVVHDATARDAGARDVLVAPGPISVGAPGDPYDGPDCSTSYAPRPDRDPSPMCFAPGGTFRLGPPEGESWPNATPAHDVTLSPFFIDQYEVTMEQFAKFLASSEARALGCDVTVPAACPRQSVAPGIRFEVDTPPDGAATSSTATFRVPAGLERHPATYMSKDGARAYCEWVGKTLPTEAQWEYAASYDPLTGAKRRFPWGDKFEPRRGNCAEELCRDGFKETSPVGTFDGTGRTKDGRSAIGIFDAWGNVSEWVASCEVMGEYQPCGDCKDPAPEFDCRLVGKNVWRGDETFDVSFDPAAKPLPLWVRPSGRSPQGDLARGFRCVTAAVTPREGEAQTAPRSSPAR